MESSVDDSQLRRVFENWTPELTEALKSHVLRYAIGLQSWVKTTYLSDDPLHQRTGKLFNSINYSPVEVGDHRVSSNVGTNIKYAAVHELGLTVTVPEHQRTMSAVFGRPVEPRMITVGQHEASYPVRAFLAPSISDTADDWQTEMDQAVEDAAAAVEAASGAT